MLKETLDVARDMGRLNEIAGVLICNGLGDSVRRVGPADRLSAQAMSGAAAMGAVCA